MPELDKKIWGIPENKLTVIGARTSVGKTSFAIQIISDLIQQDKTIMYLGFEMKQDELLERIFCNKYKVYNTELLIGNHTNYERELDDFKKYIKKIKFVATDGFASNWSQLDKFLKELQKSPDVIIIDYIQGISQGKGQGKAFIDEYILNFRNMCVLNDFSGIVVSQLNRASQERNDKTPQLHDLKGSGYLEELADLVLLLDWTGKDKDQDENDYIVNVAKNRRGRTGFVKLKYYPQHYLFTDWNAELNAVTDQLLEEDFDE